jgi:hypothetical protein
MIFNAITQFLPEQAKIKGGGVDDLLLRSAEGNVN